MAPKRLSDLKTEDHPFNWTRYNTVIDELDDAIDRMKPLGYSEIVYQLLEARYKVRGAWDLIQAAERAEQAEDDAKGEGTV